MASAARTMLHTAELPLPLARDGIPIFYEDEEEEDMGESNPHVVTDELLHVCIGAHFKDRPQYRVFSNMNLYYRSSPRHPRTGSLPYVSPDIMVVEPFRDLGEEVSSYTIGQDGPTPEQVTEILSARSAQQRDLGEKLVIYARLRIPEYLLVDPSGEYMPERLLVKRLLPGGTWQDEQDADGGVTSRLGFRVIWDSDGILRVLHAQTGKSYIRPKEAQAVLDLLEVETSNRRKLERAARAETKARQQAEERNRVLEEELARLRGKRRKRKGT